MKHLIASKNVFTVAIKLMEVLEQCFQYNSSLAVENIIVNLIKLFLKRYVYLRHHGTEYDMIVLYYCFTVYN